LHVVFTPDDHKIIQQLLNISSQTYAYRMVLQLITVLVELTYHQPDSEYARIMDEIVHGKNKQIKMKIPAVQSDCPLYYQWACVLSSRERSWIISKAGRNFFHEQLNILKKFKKGEKGARVELLELNELVKKLIPLQVQVTIFGRLKVIKELKELHKQENIKARAQVDEKQQLKTAKVEPLTYSRCLEFANNKRKISLFAEENISGIITGYCDTINDIRDITESAFLDKSTLRVVYSERELKKSLTYTNLAQIEEDNMTEAQKQFWTYMIANIK